MKIDLGKKAVDHDGVEADDEEKGQEVAKDKETHLRSQDEDKAKYKDKAKDKETHLRAGAGYNKNNKIATDAGSIENFETFCKVSTFLIHTAIFLILVVENCALEYFTSLACNNCNKTDSYYRSSITWNLKLVSVPGMTRITW